MIAPELAFFSSSRSGRLAVRRWAHANPKAEIIFLHGIISHSGWYEASGSHLNENGFQVHSLDRRGSGLNFAHRGDVDQWTTWLSDVVEYVESLPTELPKLLFGISWGGILATSLVRVHPKLFHAYGLICPGLYSSKSTTTVQQFGLKVAELARLDRERVEVPLRDPALFTNSPSRRRYIAEDPLTLRKITIRFAIENLKLWNHAVDQPDQIKIPMLLMLADADPITDNESTRAFVSKMGSEDKSVMVYHDASHTLEFEPDPSGYLNDLTRWCVRQSSVKN
ncbi:alpha/beta fold hydrolase [Neorhodopirellula pilleata]|uniref:Phospholipase YtpA n=1 Tax=Neorhodopirellula pilleata TaxID=2714738 RepID=A0A5C6AGY3_9BACT|nr:alpha/beta fold hydrolase [Neorhodopirellula pilleata]TWT98710.1 Phospholipase YtpA [Neorhodopirellula pilleata]